MSKREKIYRINHFYLRKKYKIIYKNTHTHKHTVFNQSNQLTQRASILYVFTFEVLIRCPSLLVFWVT